MGLRSIAFALGFLASTLTLAAESPSVPAPITVPQGNGAPVITDGIFSPGEWDDALRVQIHEGVALYIKEYGGVVFLGLRGQGNVSPIGPSELFIAVPGGPITKLHVSWGMSEVVLPPTGAEPASRLGLTTDWYANELRRDEDLGRRLAKEGKEPIEIIKATNYPSEGIEFAIRRTRFPGPKWFVRLSVQALVADRPVMFIYPESAPERTTEGWLELRIN